MMIAHPTTTIEDNDPRVLFCQGIGEEIKNRWPDLVQTQGNCLTGGGYAYPRLQVRLPDECGYNYVHLLFGHDLFVDADGDYGPDMTIGYEEPDLVDNVLAFVLAVSSSRSRPWKAGGTIDLQEWRQKLTASI